MSQVIVTFKVMPNGVEVDLDDLEKKIKNSINPEKIEREPIAFGLVALNVTKLVADAEGQVENIENKLREIEEVSGVEVTKVTRSI